MVHHALLFLSKFSMKHQLAYSTTAGIIHNLGQIWIWCLTLRCFRYSFYGLACPPCKTSYNFQNVALQYFGLRLWKLAHFLVLACCSYGLFHTLCMFDKPPLDFWYGHLVWTLLVDTTEKLPSDILLPLMFVKLLFPQHYSLTLSLPCFFVQIKHKICKNMNYVQQQCEHYH